MGPPWAAISAATAALQHLHHYPAANFEPAISDLARFLAPDTKEGFEDIRERLLLGNGASELIDLVTRVGAHQGNFYVDDTQYKEYCRAALASGRERLDDLEDAEDFALIAIVNPCNPTGVYRKVDEMKAHVEATCTDHTTVFDRRVDAALGWPTVARGQHRQRARVGRENVQREGHSHLRDPQLDEDLDLPGPSHRQHRRAHQGRHCHLEGASGALVIERFCAWIPRRRREGP